MRASPGRLVASDTIGDEHKAPPVISATAAMTVSSPKSASLMERVTPSDQSCEGISSTRLCGCRFKRSPPRLLPFPVVARFCVWLLRRNRWGCARRSLCRNLRCSYRSLRRHLRCRCRSRLWRRRYRLSCGSDIMRRSDALITACYHPVNATAVSVDRIALSSLTEWLRARISPSSAR